MTVHHGAQPGGTRESDSEKIDRIAAYVGEARKAEKSWTERFGKFTVYLALAAFFFGIGNVTDLRNRLAAPAPTRAQAAKDAYVSTLDTYCKGFVGVRPGVPKGGGYARIAADDLDVLTARNRMNLAWNTYPIPGDMAPSDAGTFESIRSSYFAANDLLQAAVEEARAQDSHGYAFDIGLYRQANAEFLRTASDYGFTVCDHYWPVDDAPSP
jgi:hypothetical protein